MKKSEPTEIEGKGYLSQPSDLDDLDLSPEDRLIAELKRRDRDEKKDTRNLEKKLRRLRKRIGSTMPHDDGKQNPSEASPLGTQPRSDRVRGIAEEDDEGSEADWQEIKAEVLKLLQVELLDTPASHLAYIRERLKPVFDHVDP